MRVLHTADWHVGRGLAGRSRADEHRAVLGEIAAVAADEGVDLILVAGDLFDVSAPPPEAESIVYRALLELGRIAPVVVIPGNHDNERRLDAVAPLFKPAGVTIRPFVAGSEPLEIESRSGERACIATLPWLSQRHIVKAEHLMNDEAAGYAGLYRERVRRIVASLTSAFDTDTVNLVLAHVTIAGAEAGGGERTAQTIFDYWIDANVFPPSAHYVALGHLHKTQRMPGLCPIHYSGSPLQLDFSDDSDSAKNVVVVDAPRGAPATAAEVPLSAGRRLRTLTGTMDRLRSAAGTTGEDYLRVIVKEQARVGLADEIRELFPNAVKVMVESATNERDPCQTARSSGSPTELFATYLAERNIDDARLLALFGELYEECA